MELFPETLVEAMLAALRARKKREPDAKWSRTRWQLGDDARDMRRLESSVGRQRTSTFVPQRWRIGGTAVLAICLIEGAACGDDATGSGGAGGHGNESSSSSGDFCGAFENWTCQTTPTLCLAQCSDAILACGSLDCELTLAEGSPMGCPGVAPTSLPDCGDCRAAFASGCH